VLGIGQSMGIFGLVGVLGTLAGVPGTDATAIALATGLPGLQAINKNVMVCKNNTNAIS